MKIKVLKRTANELKIEVDEKDHTLFNLLRKVLLEDERVEMAGYKVPHPLIPKTILYVRTKEELDPELALKEAVEKIRKRNQELRKAFERSLERWKELQVKPSLS